MVSESECVIVINTTCKPVEEGGIDIFLPGIVDSKTMAQEWIDNKPNDEREYYRMIRVTTHKRID